MQRFPPFDPPEYVNWKPDAALVKAYRATIEADSERAAVVSALSPDAKLALYAGLLRARLHDIQLQRWVRTGVISKAWLGTGEEGTTVGPVHALERGSDVVAPMIRNAAACCELGMPIADMLRAYLATDDSPSRGRHLHVGAWTHGVLQPISHVGDMVPVVTGVALTFKMRGERRVALTWVGDGSSKTAAAQEAMTLAAVQRVPRICILQNNQVAFRGAVVRGRKDAGRGARGGGSTPSGDVPGVGQARPRRPVRRFPEGRGTHGAAAGRGGGCGAARGGAGGGGSADEP